MEQIENDRVEINDLSRPILENYKTYTEHSILISDHMKTIESFSLSSEIIDERVTSPPEKTLRSAQKQHIEELNALISDFTIQLDENLKNTHKLREIHQENYKTYNDCLRKLDRFNLSIDEKSSNDKPISNSESQRVILLVTRMQESRASLCLSSTQCHEKLSELKLEQESLYKNLIKEFRDRREMLFRRTAEHLHYEMRSY